MKIDVQGDIDIELQLVIEPGFRAIGLGLSTSEYAGVLDSQDARNLAKHLIEMADRLDTLGGADFSSCETPSEKPS